MVNAHWVLIKSHQAEADRLASYKHYSLIRPHVLESMSPPHQGATSDNATSYGMCTMQSRQTEM